MEDKNRQLAAELMIGAYDLHVHSSPSVFRRACDGVELIKAADAAGMAGIMLKSHYEPTALRAALINKYSGCRTRAYGSVVLNWPVGGLNVYAVEEALKAGARIVWMPTRDAANSLCFGNMEGDFFDRHGISVLDESGKLKPEVYDIMDTVKRYGRFLATGHISPAESVVLCREGRARGVNMILTHPEFPRTTMDGALQKEIADLGVLIEKNWFNIATRAVTIEKMTANIRTVGAERCYIATDRGQPNTPVAPEEYRRFVEALLGAGLTEKEVRFLTTTVPGKIVNT